MRAGDQGCAGLARGKGSNLNGPRRYFGVYRMRNRDILFLGLYGGFLISRALWGGLCACGPGAWACEWGGSTEQRARLAHVSIDSCRKVSRSSELRLRGSGVRPACSRLSRVERFTNIYGRSSTGPLHVTCMSTCTLHVHVHAHVNLMPIVMFHVPCPCPCMCAPNCDLCVLGKLLSLDIAASLLWWLVTLFPCISVHCGIGHCCGCIMYRVHGVSLRGVVETYKVSRSAAGDNFISYMMNA